MFKKIKDWLVENKEDIKTCYAILISLMFVVLALFNYVVCIMCQDLAQKAQIQEDTIKSMQYDLEYDGKLIEHLIDIEDKCAQYADKIEEEE